MSQPFDSEDTTEQETLPERTETVSRVFGSDVWLRFDMWASRSWKATEQALELSATTPAPVSSDDVVFDPRVAALFHAAETAKEFAEMVNPTILLDPEAGGRDFESGLPGGVTLTMLMENEELD